MNRDELKDIRGYIDERFRNFKPKFPQMQQENITATASRRALLRNANCISCDQVVSPKEAESKGFIYILNFLYSRRSKQQKKAFFVQIVIPE